MKLLATLTATILAMLPLTASAGDIFPDEALEAAIKAVLKKQGKDTIKAEDLKNVYQVTARVKGIKVLTGLDKCMNMALIDFAGNEIADLAPIAGLVNLQSLDVATNKINDVKPLEKLVKLQYVKIEANEIADLTPLKDLKKLSALYAAANKVTSVEPLTDLPKLSSLDLASNQVSDIAPLGTLKWLANLNLRANKVADLSPLTTLTELRFTFLQDNQIHDFGPLIEMAKKDAAGERRFAPYWRLYTEGNPIDAAKRHAQVTELKALGVRVDPKQR